MKKLVLFGTGDIAQIAKDYFNDDSEFEVVAFTVDAAYRDGDSYEALPVVDFESVEETYPPESHHMFIALSYAQMNKLREEKYHAAKAKGYTLATYISSKCSYLSKYPCGDNCFIFEDNTVQPYVQMGSNVFLWSGNHIGHHSVIESHNFVSSHVVISGHCTIKSHCFLGVNATLAHQVTIAEETLLGAGVVISKDTEAKGVYVAARPTKISKTSDQIKL